MSVVLLYSAQSLLEHPATAEVLRSYTSYNWNFIYDCHSLYKTNALALSDRKGIKCHPFKLDNHQFDEHYSMPDYDPTFNKTFTDVTDETATKLLQDLPSNKKILINWSGGLDSTLIVCAILKNCQLDDLEKIEIGLNQYSIYENPYFYYQFIHNKIRTKNSFLPPDFNKYIVIEGEPEMPSIGKYINFLVQFPEIYDQNISTHGEKYLNYLAGQTNNNFANTFYEMLLENINSVDYPIETVGDLLWWENYNWHWKGRKGENLFRKYPHVDPAEYFSGECLWYSNQDYQKWIMKNKGFGVTHGVGPSELKFSQKKYIYEFDKNSLYFKFKSKFSSGSRPMGDNSFTMLTDDFKKLTLKNNLDEIIDLLPQVVI